MASSLLALIAIGETESRYALVTLAAVLAIAVLVGWRRRSTRSDPRDRRGNDSQALVQGTAVAADLQRLLEEVEEFSERLAAQLDDKLADVRQAAAEADKRISALRILIDAADSRRRGHAVPPPTDQAISPLAPDPPQASPSTDPSQAADAAAWPYVTDWTADDPPASLDSPASGGDPRHRPIYALADEGLPPLQIAQRLGRAVGEVELILNLRRVAQKRTEPGPP